jgi:hypothetical protein
MEKRKKKISVKITDTQKIKALQEIKKIMHDNFYSDYGIRNENYCYHIFIKDNLFYKLECKNYHADYNRYTLDLYYNIDRDTTVTKNIFLFSHGLTNTTLLIDAIIDSTGIFSDNSVLIKHSN